MGIELKVESNFDDIKPGFTTIMPLELPGRLTLPAVPEITGLAPDAFITRQDMMVMVAKALRVFEVLDKPANLNELDKLRQADIVGYAKILWHS